MTARDEATTLLRSAARSRLPSSGEPRRIPDSPGEALEAAYRRFPTTRYQGSKRKLAVAIARELSALSFHTALDAFGGTGAIAYALKVLGKSVTYNDHLEFNREIATALIENDRVTLPLEQVERIGERRRDVTYGDFIERTFAGIYFTDDENRWLDAAVANLRCMDDRFARAIAWFAVLQAAIAKRPYNLFHRRNLYMRLADVRRGFGNKRTWDRPFPELVRRFAEQANRAIVRSASACRVLCSDVADLETHFDLVYLDPPYMSRRGVGVPYRDFYHFLEGMIRYDDWAAQVDPNSRHRALVRRANPWTDPGRLHDAFRNLFHRFRRSILAVSYRSDGTPTVEELTEMLSLVKDRVRVIELGEYGYALSDNRTSREMLIIGSSFGAA